MKFTEMRYGQFESYHGCVARWHRKTQMVWLPARTSNGMGIRLSARTSNGVGMPNCWESSLDAPPDQILTDSGLICASGHRNLLFYLRVTHARIIQIFQKKMVWVSARTLDTFGASGLNPIGFPSGDNNRKSTLEPSIAFESLSQAWFFELKAQRIINTQKK